MSVQCICCFGKELQNCPIHGAARSYSVVQHVYTRAGRAAVCGIPGDDHNCDEMGCPSVEHVLFRAPHSTDEKPDKDALARIDAVIGRIDTTLKFSARPWPIEVLEDARLELQRFRALLNNQS